MGDVPYGLRRYQQHEQTRIAGRDAEIERLRAEIETLRAALAVKDNHDHFDCTAEREVLRLENQRLQALIDAYAAAIFAVSDPWAKSKDPWSDYMAARDALLAVATKEDDRD